MQRAREAITALQKQGRPINFKAVSETAKVSTAWLYAQPDARRQIEHLRSQEMMRHTAIQRSTTPSDASKDSIIAALRSKIKALEEKNGELSRQLEVTYGQFYFSHSAGVSPGDLQPKS